MPGEFKVFLSHAQEDYQLVRRVWTILRRLKVKPYIYERYPDYQQDIPIRIREVLKNKNCVMCIAFLTRDGISSQWVQQELGIAYAFNKIIVPVVQKGVEYKGFVQMRTQIPYQVRRPDTMISHVIYAVRTHAIQQYGKVEDGLTLTCPNGHENDYNLPSNARFNQVTEAHKFFTYRCLTCNEKIDVSPRTLETAP